MPTKRKPRSRPWRARFSAETLALFQKLENGPERGVAYSAGERVLMRELDLIDAWWGGVTVTGRTKPPRPWLYAYQSWLQCQKVRRELLAAVEELEELEPTVQATTVAEQ